MQRTQIPLAVVFVTFRLHFSSVVILVAFRRRLLEGNRIIYPADWQRSSISAQRFVFYLFLSLQYLFRVVFPLPIPVIMNENVYCRNSADEENQLSYVRSRDVYFVYRLLRYRSILSVFLISDVRVALDQLR